MEVLVFCLCGKCDKRNKKESEGGTRGRGKDDTLVHFSHRKTPKFLFLSISFVTQTYDNAFYAPEQNVNLFTKTRLNENTVVL